MAVKDEFVYEELIDLAIHSCLRQQWARMCEEQRAAPAVLISLKNSKKAGEIEIIMCSPEDVSIDRVISIIEATLALLKNGNVR